MQKTAIFSSLGLMFNMRIGFGKDIHCLKEGIELIIGGVKIPSKIGSYSYSDGDALTHALIDSLLGALALNDIGEHFKDNELKLGLLIGIIILIFSQFLH